MTTQATLCFILVNDKVLLLKKSAGLFGGGKWNAPGGKVRPSEDPEDCAIREVFEETGLKIRDLEKVGLLHFFKNGQRETQDWVVSVFITQHLDGSPTGGREGDLKWFHIQALPFEEMWEDDRYWCPLALQRKHFQGWFYFSRDFKKLIDHRIEVIGSMFDPSARPHA